MALHSDIMKSAFYIVLVILLGLKLTESWIVGEDGWLSDSFPDEDYMADSPSDVAGSGRQSLRIRQFFQHRGEPTSPGQKCDGCRIIAFRLDKAFDFAESQAGVGGGGGGYGTNNKDDELSEDEVNVIINTVCTKKTFSKVRPFQAEDRRRLLASGIETPILYQNMKRSREAAAEKKTDVQDEAAAGGDRHDDEADDEADGVDWPQRLKNHCKFLVTERLYGKDVYEMWLRTSAASYSDVRTFESFLCFAEYVFGDCVRSPSDPEINNWPAGDDPDPDDDDVAGAGSDDEQAMLDFEYNFANWYEETHGGVYHDAAAPAKTCGLLNVLISCFLTFAFYSHQHILFRALQL